MCIVGIYHTTHTAPQAHSAHCTHAADVQYHYVMTEDPITRLHITLPASEVAAIEEFRFANRIPTRAEAIRRLIEMGLKAAKSADKSTG